MKLSEIPPTGAETYFYISVSRKNCSRSKIFCADIITKTLSQHRRLCRKRLRFITTKSKISSSLDVLYITWPKFLCTVLTLQNFIHSQKAMKSSKTTGTYGWRPSIVLTRKAVVDKTHVRKSTNVCKAIVRIDASQLYLYSMCQPRPARLYRGYEFDADFQRLKPRQKESGSVENMVLSWFKRMRPGCKIVSFHTIGSQKKIDCLNADGFCGHRDTVFEAMSFFYHYCPFQEARPDVTEEEIQRRTK